LWNASAKFEDGVSQCLLLVSQINWLPLQRPLRGLKMNIRLIMPAHVSTKAENVVKIGPIYRVSQKSNPLRLLHILPLVANLRIQKFTQLFAIHILTYVPILVHLY